MQVNSLEMRTVADEPREVIVERSTGGGLMAIVAILVIALLAVGAFALIQSRNNRDDAIATAAHQVGDAAQKAGDAAQDTAK